MLSPDLQSYAEQIAASHGPLSVEDRIVIESLQNVSRATQPALMAARLSLQEAIESMKPPVPTVRTCCMCGNYAVTVAGDVCSHCWRQAIAR